MKANNQKETNTKPFNFYGARKTSNPKYYSVSLVRGSDDKREWLNVPVNVKKIRLKDGYVLLKLALLEANRDDDDDEVDYDEVRILQSVTKPKTNAKAKKTDNDDDDLPF